MIEITHAMYVDVLDISFVVRDSNIIKIGLKSGGELKLTFEDETKDISNRLSPSKANVEIAQDEFIRIVELIKLEKLNLIKSLAKNNRFFHF